MNLLDRYIARQFLVNFVILLFVLLSLFVLIELVISLDDFLEAGQMLARVEVLGPEAWEMDKAVVEAVEVSTIRVIRATIWAIWDWHAPIALLIYVYLAGLVAVAAMGFTFSDLARKGELVAVLTSGLSMYRMAAPVLIAGGLISLSALPIQEILIPREAGRLTREHDPTGMPGLPDFEVRFAPDGDGNLYCASRFDPEARRLEDLRVLLRDPDGRPKGVIVAQQAFWREATGGWELIQGYRQDVMVAGRLRESGGGIGADVPEVAFIDSRLTPRVLLARRAEIYPSLLSIAELRRLADGRAIDPARVSHIMHRRFSFLVVNMLVMMMGLPFFLSREPANPLLAAVRAAAVCIGAWASSLVVLQLGAERLDPVAAAWLPVVIYVPLTVWLLLRIRT